MNPKYLTMGALGCLGGSFVFFLGNWFLTRVAPMIISAMNMPGAFPLLSWLMFLAGAAQDLLLYAAVGCVAYWAYQISAHAAAAPRDPAAK